MDLLSSSEEEGVPMFVSNVLKIRPAFNIKDLGAPVWGTEGASLGQKMWVSAG